MKLFFSLIFLILFSNTVYSSEAVLLTYLQDQELAAKAQKILINKFYIPKALITMRRTKEPCHRLENVIIHLCFEKDQMKILYVNQKEKEEKLGVFYED